jgi:membrane dipeptidase
MPTVDLHSDIQLELARPGVNPAEVFGAKHESGMDIGDITVRILATFSPPPDPTAAAFRHIAATRAAGLRIVTRPEELDSNGRAFILGLEGAEPFGRDLSLVEAFYWAGVRVVGLAWMEQNAVTGACGEPRAGGITSFGIEVLRLLEALGAIVDLAHISDHGFTDTLDLYGGPLMCSHTCARALRDHPRNITDEQAKALGQRGGIIGVCFYGDFLGADSSAWTIERIVDHIEHFVELVGENSVALGPDWSDDWTDYTIELCNSLNARVARGINQDAEYALGLGDSSGLRALEAALQRRGLPSGKIMYGNAMEFLSRTLK